MFLKEKLFYYFPKPFFKHFFSILVTTAALFFSILTSLNSISEPVLGAINERYDVLCDVRMSVCMCLKESGNYGQPVRVFFHSKVGKYGFRNSKSKSKSKLHYWFKTCNNFDAVFSREKQIKNFKRRHVGCLSRGNRLEFCAAHSDFILVECILSEIPKKNNFRA